MFASRGKKIAELGRRQYEAFLQEDAWMAPPQTPNEDLEDDMPENREDQCETDCESDHSDHNTDTEQSDDDEEEALSSGETCLGRDNETVWRMHPLQKRKSLKRKRKNIVIHLPGPKGEAKNANTIEDSWKLFFPDETIQYIVSCTNIYIDAMQPKFERSRDCKKTDFEEISAVLGLLYMAGLKKANQSSFCAFCPRRANKKTKKYCHQCRRPICPTHTVFTCGDCAQEHSISD
nr:unnamed protein product [Callosobruchus chinensis]